MRPAAAGESGGPDLSLREKKLQYDKQRSTLLLLARSLVRWCRLADYPPNRGGCSKRTPPTARPGRLHTDPVTQKERTQRITKGPSPTSHLHLGAPRRTMDAGELMSSLSSQLAGEDGLYGNCGTLAALFSAPQQDVVQATPDNSFAWSPCTYTLTTPEGAWPTSFSTVAPPSVSMERLPLATASGWAWHKNHQLPRLNVSCGAGAPLEP